jgi:hypothetical protein
LSSFSPRPVWVNHPDHYHQYYDRREMGDKSQIAYNLFYLSLIVLCAWFLFDFFWGIFVRTTAAGEATTQEDCETTSAPICNDHTSK